MNNLQHERYPLDLKDIRKVEVIGHRGEVSVLTGDQTPELEIFRTGKICVTIQKKKEVLRIFTETPFFSSKSSEARIHLKIPSGMGIKIVGESVPVRIKGDYGIVKIVGNEGDIILDEASGSFSLLSAKGDIVLRHLQGEVNASTQDGDIIASHIFGKYKLTSATGTMTLAQGEGTFRLFSRYALRVQDIRFRKGLENRLYCKGSIRLSGLSAFEPSVISVTAPEGRILTELSGFGISGSGKEIVATAFGPDPSKLRLHSDEEILLSSSDRLSATGIAV